MSLPDDVTGSWNGTLASLLGIQFVEVTKDRVIAELAIREELQTVGGALHGGALMAFADTVGAVATIANLAPGSTTSTLESRDQFSGGRAHRGSTGGSNANSCRPANDGMADPDHR